MARSSIDFDGRRVIVTGASSGLGRACAVELSAHGASVVLVGRNVDRLAETRAALGDGDHHVLVFDLNDLSAMSDRIVTVSGRLGRIYGLCHAAGVAATLPLSMSSPELVEPIVRTNVLAALEMARTVVRHDILSAEGGSLLFLSSVYARAGAAGAVAYAATKGAVAAAVRSLAVELARRNVRVNSLSPGLVRTPMTDSAFEPLSPEQVSAIEQRHPLGPGDPEDVARAAVFLLSPAARWITGADLAVDGGYSAQ